jgi:predicted TIM-barrel fold metal-dependent hydrolase
MARLPFVDTHVHFFDMHHPKLRYVWLEPDAEIDPMVGEDGAIRAQRYWADDFIAESRFHNVSKVVHVQAAIGTEDAVEETKWLQAFSDRLGVPHGVIAYIDLTDDDAADQLARHREFPVVRGIRDIRYDDYLDNEVWRRGYALLDGLVCCDDPFIEEMPKARRLAEEFPGVTLCIDHAAYPGVDGNPREHSKANFDAWRDGIRELAAAPNVVMKISGLGMSDHEWTPDSVRRWVTECIDAFGVERCFFGSNWPLDRLYCSYGDVVNGFAEVIADLSEAEQRALFSENAERIFGLKEG